MGVAKGKGRGLGSIGDLLKTVGSRVNVKVGKDEGIGAGATKIPMIFSAKKNHCAKPCYQDQLVGRRVHQAPLRGQAALANRPWQVPAFQGWVQHAEAWYP